MLQLTLLEIFSDNQSYTSWLWNILPFFFAETFWLLKIGWSSPVHSPSWSHPTDVCLDIALSSGWAIPKPLSRIGDTIPLLIWRCASGYGYAERWNFSFSVFWAKFWAKIDCYFPLPWLKHQFWLKKSSLKAPLCLTVGKVFFWWSANICKNILFSVIFRIFVNYCLDSVPWYI